MSVRGEVLEWFAEGRVSRGRERAALRAAGMIPTGERWLAFLERLTQWLGALALAIAIIFFFAYNWDDLDRVVKICMAEVAIVAGLLACWRLDLDGTAGRAVLTLLSLLVGALLALTGQIYQTGADTFELFAWWAALILPWVLIARFAPLWLIWLALLDVAAIQYFSFTRDGVAVLWSLFVLNGAALIVWEAARRSGSAWMLDSWPPRLIAVAGAASATTLMVWMVFDGHGRAATLSTASYALWLAATYGWYRHARPDLLMLAAAVLSLIVAVAAFLSRHMLESGGAGGFLFIGLVVIAMSALGALGLRSVAQEIAA